MLKPEQSALPGEVPLVHGPVYRVASVCQECRWHVDIVVDVCDKGAKSTPCRQFTAWQLHHFVFQGEEKPKGLQNGGHHPSSNLDVRRIFKFACSAPECPAQVLIHMRPPVFKDEYIDLLTSKTHLRNRLETAKQLGGDRDFTQVARPVDALDYLTTYLNDSLKPKQGKARIPVLNRMFMKTFGKDCDQVLKTLGFTSDVDEAADGSRVEVWNLPKPPPAGAYPDPADNPRTVVEDARQELAILIQALPETDRSSTRNSTVFLEPSLKMIERVLSCDDYLKRPTSGTRSVSHEVDHPYYSGLGAVGDFSDELLLFAYTAQWQADPVNGPYYFECLQDLAIGRKSTELEIQVQMLASKGHSNRKEVNNAYLYLAMDPRHAHVLGDEHIIGQFRARLQDIGPGAVQETRNMLRIIASARNSERIRQEASSAIETYSQALNCLDAQEETDDDVIITCYSLKASDSAASQEIAAKAVAIIAEHRNSQRLRQYLKTGDAGVKIGMDIGEAYAVLNISDRTERLDPETLRMQVDSLSLDMPQEKAKYEEAYAMVTHDQQNNNKTSKNAEVRPARSNHPLDSWPVGCFNIGNTCYLNSVLQFLFTIVPLREMVLECERYLQEITPEVLERKRVGRTAIDMEKAERAQQCE
jgi:ubiquitin carboxyl-terminal hydrolase 25/28